MNLLIIVQNLLLKEILKLNIPLKVSSLVFSRQGTKRNMQVLKQSFLFCQKVELVLPES